MIKEPKVIEVIANDKFLRQNGLKRNKPYNTKFQDRDYNDTSKIVYIKSPFSETALIALTKDEYKIIEYYE